MIVSRCFPALLLSLLCFFPPFIYPFVTSVDSSFFLSSPFLFIPAFNSLSSFPSIRRPFSSLPFFSSPFHSLSFLPPVILSSVFSLPVLSFFADYSPSFFSFIRPSTSLRQIWPTSPAPSFPSFTPFLPFLSFVLFNLLSFYHSSFLPFIFPFLLPLPHLSN